MNRISFKLPPISRYSSRREWEEACWKKIVKSGEFLELLVTPYESHHIVMRVAVIERLNSGKRFVEVAEELGLSPQTISSIKKAINETGYRSYWERSKTERKKRLYSPDTRRKKKRYKGRPVRTKYGTIYLPYWNIKRLTRLIKALWCIIAL